MTIVYNIFRTLAEWTAKLFFNFQVIHPERIPEDGGIILASNHQSYFDPPLIGACSHRGVHFLARNTLLKWPFFGPLFPQMNVIPVDRGGNDMAALKTVVRKIREGEGVVLFPEGTRTRDGELQPAQPGVGLVIAKTLAPVVPIRIFGAYDAFPKGAKGVRLTPISIVIGEPIHFTAEDVGKPDRDTYRRLGQRVMDEIAKLSLDSAS